MSVKQQQRKIICLCNKWLGVAAPQVLEGERIITQPMGAVLDEAESQTYYQDTFPLLWTSLSTWRTKVFVLNSMSTVKTRELK